MSSAEDYDAELSGYCNERPVIQRRWTRLLKPESRIVRYQGYLAIGIFLLIVTCISTCDIQPAYAQDGTASYYTYKSCVREGTSGVWTATGERFDENAMTCAMPDRKMFGKYVKVTNLVNGKSVVVRVNDYGPNKKLVKQGRVVDLSKGAFAKIASLKQGLIKVRVEEI